jgi:hypothetical protein
MHEEPQAPAPQQSRPVYKEPPAPRPSRKQPIRVPKAAVAAAEPAAPRSNGTNGHNGHASWDPPEIAALRPRNGKATADSGFEEF